MTVSVTRKARAAFAAVVGIAMSALLWFVVVLLAGVSLIVAGIFLMFGLGAALLAGGVVCLLASGVIAKGMRHG